VLIVIETNSDINSC